jgi:hypothetical protein
MTNIFCLQHGCKVFDVIDLFKSTIFFKRLAELIKEKATKVKIAVEAKIRYGSKTSM